MNSKEGRNAFWKNTVRKYGWESIKLVDGLTESQALEIEKQYIKKYGLRHEGGVLTNLTMGGAGGNTITPFNRSAFIEKCRENKIGVKNPNYGKATATKGKPCPAHVKEAISRANRGRRFSEKRKEEQREYLRRGREAKLQNSYKVMCLLTGKIWNNRIECIKELGITIECFKSRIYKGTTLTYLK